MILASASTRTSSHAVHCGRNRKFASTMMVRSIGGGAGTRTTAVAAAACSSTSSSTSIRTTPISIRMRRSTTALPSVCEPPAAQHLVLGRKAIRYRYLCPMLPSSHFATNYGCCSFSTNKNTNHHRRRVAEIGENDGAEEEEENQLHGHDEHEHENHPEHGWFETDRTDTLARTRSNPGLASVISQGIKSLDQTAEDTRFKTRNDTLARAHKKPSFRNGRAAEMDPRQLAEGQRILDVASECLERLAAREEQQQQHVQQQRRGQQQHGNGLFLFGEPIVLLECEVNRNVRQAKVYWTLPYGLLLDNRINQGLYQEIMVRVQGQLVSNGGAKLLAREVHTRLSYYYPPRIKLFPATDEMVQKAIEEFMM